MPTLIYGAPERLPCSNEPGLWHTTGQSNPRTAASGKLYAGTEGRLCRRKCIFVQLEHDGNRNTAWSLQMRFAMICEANDIEQRLTKPNHSWTNGHVERMNRTIKEATVKRFHYESHDQLRTTSPTSWLPTVSPASSRHSAASPVRIHHKKSGRLSHQMTGLNT